MGNLGELLWCFGECRWMVYDWMEFMLLGCILMAKGYGKLIMVEAQQDYTIRCKIQNGKEDNGW